MSGMDIPYKLNMNEALPTCLFHSIWKVQVNDTYQVTKPNGFPIPGLFITYEGKGSLSQGSERTELHAGTFFLIRENTPCSYRCHDDDWKFYFIDFSSLEMAEALTLPLGHSVTSAKIPEAIVLCERLIDNLIVQPAGYEYSTHIILQELLLLFSRERSAGSATRYPELDAVLFRMHRSIGEPFRMETYIAQSKLSRTAFFSRFRAMTGKSPNQYMLELKLASAKASLETTSLTVKEIAAALHFYDEFHLSKAFKTRFGLSPREFRQERSSRPTSATIGANNSNSIN